MAPREGGEGGEGQWSTSPPPPPPPPPTQDTSAEATRQADVAAVPSSWISPVVQFWYRAVKEDAIHRVLLACGWGDGVREEWGRNGEEEDQTSASSSFSSSWRKRERTAVNQEEEEEEEDEEGGIGTRQSSAGVPSCYTRREGVPFSSSSPSPPPLGWFEEEEEEDEKKKKTQKGGSSGIGNVKEEVEEETTEEVEEGASVVRIAGDRFRARPLVEAIALLPRHRWSVAYHTVLQLDAVLSFWWQQQRGSPSPPVPLGPHREKDDAVIVQKGEGGPFSHASSRLLASPSLFGRVCEALCVASEAAITLDGPSLCIRARPIVEEETDGRRRGGEGGSPSPAEEVEGAFPPFPPYSLLQVRRRAVQLARLWQLRHACRRGLLPIRQACEVAFSSVAMPFTADRLLSALLLEGGGEKKKKERKREKGTEQLDGRRPTSSSSSSRMETIAFPSPLNGGEREMRAAPFFLPVPSPLLAALSPHRGEAESPAFCLPLQEEEAGSGTSRFPSSPPPSARVAAWEAELLQAFEKGIDASCAMDLSSWRRRRTTGDEDATSSTSTSDAASLLLPPIRFVHGLYVFHPTMRARCTTSLLSAGSLYGLPPYIRAIQRPMPFASSMFGLPSSSSSTIPSPIGGGGEGGRVVTQHPFPVAEVEVGEVQDEEGSRRPPNRAAWSPHGPSTGVSSSSSSFESIQRRQETTTTTPSSPLPPSLTHVFFPSPYSLDPLLFDVPPLPSHTIGGQPHGPRHGPPLPLPPPPVDLPHLSLVQEELVDIARSHAVFGLVMGDADQIVLLLRQVHQYHASSYGMEEEEKRIKEDPLRDVVRRAVLDVHLKQKEAEDEAKEASGMGFSPPFHTFVHWWWGTQRWWCGNRHSSRRCIGERAPSTHQSQKDTFYAILFVAVRPMEDAFLPFSASPEEERSGGGGGGPPDGSRQSDRSSSPTSRRSAEREASEEAYRSSLPEIPYYIAGVLELAREGWNTM